MPDYYSGNYYLSLAQMQVNARYLYGLLNAEGWTLNAIAGLLGNTQTESTHNPGITQSLKQNPKLGYGLTQWTPSTKYTNWCAERGLVWTRMESAVARLMFEVENPSEQWVVHDAYPMSFAEFIVSEDSPYDLAMTFLNNYEMPGDLNQPKRGEQANYWYEFLSGEEPPDPPDHNPDRNLYTRGKGILVPLLKRRRKYGKIK